MESDSVPKNASSPAPEVDLIPKYTIPGILHFIQHEWTRFEMDRAHWEVERAELQVRKVDNLGLHLLFVMYLNHVHLYSVICVELNRLL